MVHSKFGSPDIAQVTMESFTTAVLEARLLPPSPPRSESWRDIMEELSSISCEAYRCGDTPPMFSAALYMHEFSGPCIVQIDTHALLSLPEAVAVFFEVVYVGHMLFPRMWRRPCAMCWHVASPTQRSPWPLLTPTAALLDRPLLRSSRVQLALGCQDRRPTPPLMCRDVVYRNPDFVKYFRTCTPEAELGKLKIGSRPTRRKPADAGVGSLRAIPWIFAWTQTRHVLPSWLGIGEALEAAMPQHGAALREMLREWPFFGSMLSLVEMTLAKADMNVAGYYDKVRTPPLPLAVRLVHSVSSQSRVLISCRT